MHIKWHNYAILSFKGKGIYILIAEEFWVINWEGAPLFTFSFEDESQTGLLSGFFQTIQSFAKSLVESDDHISTITLGDSNFNFHNNQIYKLYFILKSSKKVKEKNVNAILSTIEETFIEDFRSELIISEVDASKYEKFRYKIKHYFDKELLEKMDNRIVSNKSSPKMKIIEGQKFMTTGAIMDRIKMTIKVAPKAIGAMRHAKTSYESISENPIYPYTEASGEFIKEFEEMAHSLGVGTIGYTKLGPEDVYKGYSVLFPNTIVLGLEMDKDIINKAPSLATTKMIMESYRDLNKYTNVLAKFLRDKNYAAEAGPSLGGFANYVHLAQKAGIGWVGKLGVLITPEFGPRQRLSILTTSIENLPFSQDNPHSWITEFCGKCQKCITICPGNAILEKPIIHETGRHTHIDSSKCFPHFYTDYGCTVCIKECVFSNNDYDTLKNGFQ